MAGQVFARRNVLAKRNLTLSDTLTGSDVVSSSSPSEKRAGTSLRHIRNAGLVFARGEMERLDMSTQGNFVAISEDDRPEALHRLQRDRSNHGETVQRKFR